MKTNRLALNKALDALSKRIQKAESFTIEQAPAICREILTVELVNGYFTIVAGVVLAAVGALAARYGFTSVGKFDRYTERLTQEIQSEFAAGTGIAMMIVAAVALFWGAYRVFLVKLAPKLTVLNGIKKLLSSE